MIGRYRNAISAIACLWGAVACSAANTNLQALPPDIIYKGAEVWTGAGFELRDLAIRDGVLVPPPGGNSVETVDLRGRFIVPAYGNAHHHVTNPTDETSRSFLEEGVFYVWNPNLYSGGWSETDEQFFARSDTYDVRTSMGGLTEPGGHPEKLYVDTLAKYVYPGATLEDFLGKAFHYAGTRAEIDRALDIVEAQGATFVKIYVLYSEEYEARRDDEASYGAKGVNPMNVPYLVNAAHARGLPVAAHVQTRHDLRVVVDAGVDMLAHVPAYSMERRPEDLESIKITKGDADLVASKGILAVPTFVLSKNAFDRQAADGSIDEEMRDRQYRVQAENLRRLHDAGAAILTGTDSDYGVVGEAAHWVDIGAMTDAEALAHVLSTGTYLFPGRKIGKFDEGFEADFLVLDENPVDDIERLSKITLRIKAGKPLPPPGQDTE